MVLPQNWNLQLLLQSIWGRCLELSAAKPHVDGHEAGDNTTVADCVEGKDPRHPQL